MFKFLISSIAAKTSATTAFYKMPRKDTTILYSFWHKGVKNAQKEQ